MTHRTRWLVPYITTVVAWIIRLWMSTMRVRIKSADGRQHPADPATERFIYVLARGAAAAGNAAEGASSSASTPTAR
jgi:hypothetical protein